MNVTAFQVAQRFVGIKEVPGTGSNPAVLAMLKLDGDWPESDAVPWCSAFVNYIAWLLGLPRSRSLAARSWLEVGEYIPVSHASARVGFDVVILERPEGGPKAGHVGFYAGSSIGTATVAILGGNQGDKVSIQTFTWVRVLGIRRLSSE